MSDEQTYAITGKGAFFLAMREAKENAPYSPAVCVMRDYAFDKLHGEVASSVAEFMPDRLAPLLERLDLGRTPSFFYHGIICIRALSPYAPLYTFA